MRKKSERRYTPVESVRHLSEKIADFGDKVLYRYYNHSRTIEEITFADFSNQIRVQAAGFTSIGLVGKRIAVIGETSPFWVSTFLSGICAGNVMIPMDRELDVAEIYDFLAVAEADAIAYSPTFHEKFADIIASHPTVKTLIPLPGKIDVLSDGERILSYRDLINKGITALENGLRLPEAADTDRLAIMLFTSGTTGSSKCVMLSEKNLCASINAACQCVEFFPEDTIVSVLPIHHTYELCCHLSAINYGATIGINDSLKHVIRNFAVFQPTVLVLVPLFVSTMYKKIWDEAKKSGRDKVLAAAIQIAAGFNILGVDVSSLLFRDVLSAFGGKLTRIICGGAPLNPELVKKFAAFNIQISEGYGITECSPLISVNPYYAPKQGSVGPTVNSCVAKIDIESIDDKGRGIGEIMVKGDNVMLGYYKNDEATADVFTDDGYFRTGDIGYMDKDGYIFITGRKKSVIVLENGKNVFPEEIEEYLEKIDAIAESVVVGRKSEGSDTVSLTAVVYPAYEKFPQGTDPLEIQKIIRAEINQLNKKLTGFKQIHAVEIRTIPFEKTTSRKIKRHLVK